MKDFEDSLQIAAAENYKLDCIITRNKKDFVQSEVSVLSPNEDWIEVSPCVFVAGCRYGDKISKNDKEKLNKEIEQAKILAKENHVLFLTPERSDAGKQFDGIMDGGYTFELKKIPGNLEAVGRNFKDGAKKAEVMLSSFRRLKKSAWT